MGRLKEVGKSGRERSNRSLKRHMDSGSRCPIDVIYYCDVEVLGKRPRRGRRPMIPHTADLSPDRLDSGLRGLI